MGLAMKIEVGKKYLDNAGLEWEVTDYDTRNGIYSLKYDSGKFAGWVHDSCTPDGLITSTRYLVSEVPSPAVTTPQKPTKFKVGDRVRVKTGEDYQHMSGTVVAVNSDGDVSVTYDEPVHNYGFNGDWFTPDKLEHLTDTPTTPSLVQCTCPTVVLMRDGCRCGNARKEIEQEFKQRGWK